MTCHPVMTQRRMNGQRYCILYQRRIISEIIIIIKKCYFYKIILIQFILYNAVTIQLKRLSYHALDKLWQVIFRLQTELTHLWQVPWAYKLTWPSYCECREPTDRPGPWHCDPRCDKFREPTSWPDPVTVSVVSPQTDLARGTAGLVVTCPVSAQRNVGRGGAVVVRLRAARSVEVWRTHTPAPPCS